MTRLIEILVKPMISETRFNMYKFIVFVTFLSHSESFQTFDHN